MNGELDPNGGSKVTFSVKELLVEISRDIKDMRVDLNNKADLAVVNLLMTQVNTIDKRVITLETQDGQQTKFRDLWFPMISSTIVGLVVGAISIWAIIKAGG